MSINATRWAWSQDVKAHQKIVLLYIAYCEFPATINEIVDNTGVDRKTAISAIKVLIDKGLISESEVQFRARANARLKSYVISLRHQ